jgi:nucleoside-diphosphate-sugar epimerase
MNIVNKDNNSSRSLAVIFGTGPAGIWTARALGEMGLRVRAINRAGTRPALMPAEVDIVAADASDVRQAVEAARGAAVVYQALNPPYNKWPELFPTLQRVVMEAARAAGARYGSIDNLYGYGRVSGTLTEQTRPTPNTRKGRLRLAGLFVPAARESVEMLYQFMEPFIVSPAAIESAFGLAPTPATEGLRRTIQWWRTQ